MPQSFEVDGLITCTVGEVRLPAGSVLRRVAAFTAAPAMDIGVSLVRLELPPDGDPARDAWVAWYRQVSGIVTAKITEPGGEVVWVDVWAANDPTQPFEWVAVAHETVPAFCERLRVGRTVTLACITESLEEQKKRKKANNATPEDEALLAAERDLRSKLNSVDQGCPSEPTQVYTWFVGDNTGGGAGRAEEICEVWSTFLSLPGNPLGTNVSSMLQQVTNVRDERARSTLVPERPLDRALSLASRLEAVDRAYRRSWRQVVRDAHGAYKQPDYSVTAEQLLGEFRAFSLSARKAATHETVFGSLIESRIAELVRRAVSPLAVSSGALSGVPYPQQIDTIIWNKQLLPAVVEHGGVAVVAANCVSGVLEVKAGANLGEFGLRVEALRDDLAILRKGGPVDTIGVPVLGLIIAHDQTYDAVRAGSSNNVTVLFQKTGPFDYQPNIRGIIDLLSFLYDQVLPVARVMLTQTASRERVPHW